MRQDQFDKLQTLGERLLDVFIAEADSDKWPGAGTAPSDMTQEQRGNRVWTKRDAANTLVIVTKIETLVARTQYGGAGVTPPAPDGDEEDGRDLADEVALAERQATTLLNRLTSKRAT